MKKPLHRQAFTRTLSSAAREQKGFSLFEVLLAMFIAAVAVGE